MTHPQCEVLGSDFEPATFNNETKSGDKKHNSKPNKGWGKLGLAFEDKKMKTIILRSASVKPNTWRPK